MDTKKRERLLKAAIKIFARDGFYKARVEEIARIAGVATGTTYLYFENKDDLLISIFEEEMIPIIKKLATDLEQKKTAREKIHAFVFNHFGLVQKQPELARLLEVELRQSHQFLHNYKGSKFKDYLNIIAKAFEEGQQTGEFRTDVQPIVFKQLLFGAIDHISLNYTLSRSKKINVDDLSKQVIAVILDGILAR